MEAEILKSLLEGLRAEGAPGTPADMLRVARALRQPGPWTMARLRLTLRALMARSPEESRAFDAAFARCFATESTLDRLLAEVGLSRVDPQDPRRKGLDLQQVSAALREGLTVGDDAPQEASGPPALETYLGQPPSPSSVRALPPSKVPREDDPPGPRRRRLRWWPIALTGLLLAAATVAVHLLWPEPTPRLEPSAPPPQGAAHVDSSEPTPRLKSSTPPPKEEPTPGPQHERTWTAASYEVLAPIPGPKNKPPVSPWPGVLSSLSLLALWRLRRNLKGLKENPPPKPAPTTRFVRPFQLTPPPGAWRWLSSRVLDELADSLGHALRPGLRGTLDLPATLDASARRGGLPTLRFQGRRLPRRVLLLHDPGAEAMVWHPAALELAQGLRARGVQVTEGSFQGETLHVCLPEGRFRLEELEEEAPTLQLLLIGDSRRLVAGHLWALEARRQLRRAVARVARWPHVAFLELRSPSEWGEETARLEDAGVVVVAANNQGLEALGDRLARGQHRRGGGVGGRGAGPAPAADLGMAWLWAAACALVSPVEVRTALWLREVILEARPALAGAMPLEALTRILALPGVEATDQGIGVEPAARQALLARLRRVAPTLEIKLIGAILERFRAIPSEPTAEDRLDRDRQKALLEALLAFAKNVPLEEKLIKRLSAQSAGPAAGLHRHEIQLMLPPGPEPTGAVPSPPGPRWFAPIWQGLYRWTGLTAIWREHRAQREAVALCRPAPPTPRMDQRPRIWQGALIALAVGGLVPYLARDWSPPVTRVAFTLAEGGVGPASWAGVRLYPWAVANPPEGMDCPGEGCPGQAGTRGDAALLRGPQDFPLQIILPGGGRWAIRLLTRGGAVASELTVAEGEQWRIPLQPRLRQTPCRTVSDEASAGWDWTLWRCPSNGSPPGFQATLASAGQPAQGALSSLALVVSNPDHPQAELKDLLLSSGSVDQLLWATLSPEALGDAASLAPALREKLLALAGHTPEVVQLLTVLAFEPGKGARALAEALASDGWAGWDSSLILIPLESAQPTKGPAPYWGALTSALTSPRLERVAVPFSRLAAQLSTRMEATLLDGRGWVIPRSTPPTPPFMLSPTGEGPSDWRRVERLSTAAVALAEGQNLTKRLTPGRTLDWLDYAGDDQGGPLVDTAQLGPCWYPAPDTIDRPDRVGLPIQCRLDRVAAAGFLLRARVPCAGVGLSCAAPVRATPRPPRVTPTPRPPRATVTPSPTTPEPEAHLGTPSPPTPTPHLTEGVKAASRVTLTWIPIPGGSFMMGSNDGSSDEKPVHKVTVSAFRMSRTEVTVAQYRACLEAGACTKPRTGTYCNWGRPGREDYPINCVEWTQAKAFATWVGGRLPSEAEWEYAARGTGSRPYPWGSESPSCKLAVMSDCSGATQPVCSKTAGNTPQGLCDMAGNVWEWVEDHWHGSYAGAPSDGRAWLASSEKPSGRDAEPSEIRVLRGGSWLFVAVGLRAAFRYWDRSGVRDGSVGFRVVLPVRAWGP